MTTEKRIFHYPELHLLIKLLKKHPHRFGDLRKKTNFDEVSLRGFLTVLRAAQIVGYHKKHATYLLQNSLLYLEDYELELALSNTFVNNPNAIFSTTYLAKYFVCDYYKMSHMMSKFVADGIINQVDEDMFELSPKYEKQKFKADALAEMLLGSPIPQY